MGQLKIYNSNSMATRVSEVGKRLSINELVPYGPRLGSASIIMEELFRFTGEMGTTNITPTHLLIYLLEKMPRNEREVLKKLLEINNAEALKKLKKRLGMAPSPMFGTQKVSEDQITISSAVQLIFRRAKLVSREFGNRHIEKNHLAVALFKECE